MPKLSLSLGLDLYIAFLISKILCWLHSLKVLYMYTGKLWPPSHLPRGCLPIKLTAIRRSSDDLQWTKMIPYDFICSQDVLRIFSGCSQDVLRNVLGTFLECSQDLCRICSGYLEDLRMICLGFPYNFLRTCWGFAYESLRTCLGFL